jgi:hypothetical protein
MCIRDRGDGVRATVEEVKELSADVLVPDPGLVKTPCGNIRHNGDIDLIKGKTGGNLLSDLGFQMTTAVFQQEPAAICILRAVF